MIIISYFSSFSFGWKTYFKLIERNTCLWQIIIIVNCNDVNMLEKKTLSGCWSKIQPHKIYPLQYQHVIVAKPVTHFSVRSYYILLHGSCKYYNFSSDMLTHHTKRRRCTPPSGRVDICRHHTTPPPPRKEIRPT